MKKIVRLTESDLVRLVNRVISEQSSQLYRVGDKLKVKWINDVYSTEIYLTVKKPLTPNSMECVITRLEGPFDSLKVGTKVIVTVKNGMYKFDIKDNFQNIEGPIKGEEESIEKLTNVMNEQVKTLTVGSKGGAMINSGGNRPGHFNFVVKKVLGKNKYMVSISKWEFGSEYAKVGDSGTLTVGNKDATLNINGQVIDQLLMD
jgi:hypothetical protein